MCDNARTKMMKFHVPDDKELLAAYGELSLRHEHLTYILRMTIKTLAALEITEALDATACDGAGKLRDRLKTIGRQRLGEGKALLKLQALMERCRLATDKRNDFIHSVWGKELDGEQFRRVNDHRGRPLPTVDELKSLGQDIFALTVQLNEARLRGFLFEALARIPIVK